MTRYRTVLGLNIVSLVAVVVLVLLSKVSGSSAQDLFYHPFFDPSPEVAFLTRTFQLLCTIPVITCALTFAVLSSIRPQHPQNKFIFYAAWVTGGFLINEIYRVHIHLLYLGVPKLLTCSVYALVGLGFGYIFRKQIAKTPYFLLMTGLVLLIIGVFFDAVPVSRESVNTFLEGVPKLFSEINIALYFWYVCYRELRGLGHSKLRLSAEN